MNKIFWAYILAISVVTGLHSINENYRAYAERVGRTARHGASKALNDYSTWVPTGVYLGTRSINGGIGRKTLVPALLMTCTGFLANALKYSFPQSHAKLKKQAPSYLAPFIECPTAGILLMHSMARLVAPNNFSRIPHLAAAFIGLSGSYYYAENPQARFITS